MENQRKKKFIFEWNGSTGAKSTDKKGSQAGESEQKVVSLAKEKKPTEFAFDFTKKVEAPNVTAAKDLPAVPPPVPMSRSSALRLAPPTPPNETAAEGTVECECYVNGCQEAAARNNPGCMEHLQVPPSLSTRSSSSSSSYSGSTSSSSSSSSAEWSDDYTLSTVGTDRKDHSGLETHAMNLARKCDRIVFRSAVANLVRQERLARSIAGFDTAAVGRLESCYRHNLHVMIRALTIVSSVEASASEIVSSVCDASALPAVVVEAPVAKSSMFWRPVILLATTVCGFWTLSYWSSLA